jgi:hypothetical protein
MIEKLWIQVGAFFALSMSNKIDRLKDIEAFSIIATSSSPSSTETALAPVKPSLMIFETPRPGY